MTRTPRVKDKHLHPRGRNPAGLIRRSAAYAGAGIALAGVGTVAAVTGMTSASAATVQSAPARHAAPAKHAAPVKHAASNHAAPAKHMAPSVSAVIGEAAEPAKHATPAKHAAPAKHTAPAKARKVSHAKPATTWSAISRIVAERTYPRPTGHGSLPAQDQLTPVGTSGPQSALPMTPAMYDNAKAIVRATLDRHMGVRSAVIAVATAMQESGLVNVNYGTSDSLGLFQQRPSMGWGTAAQIMHPAYAANAFLSALHAYQQRTPGWASAPLWQTAQGVQASGYPTAYAKWEAQAASTVESITKRLV